MPLPLARGLLEWESSASLLFAVFRILGPPLLANEQYHNVDNVLSHLTSAVDLCTLIHDLV